MKPDEFALAEYTSLRAEILAQQTRRDLLLQVTVAAIWLVFVWMATRPATLAAPKVVIAALWFLPAAIAFLALLKHLAVTRGVRRAAAHLAILQANVQNPPGAGWELRLMRDSDDWRLARDLLRAKSRSPGEIDILEKIMRIRRGRTLIDDLRVEGFLGGGAFPRDIDKVILIGTVAGALLIGLAGAVSIGGIVVPLVLLGVLALSISQLKKATR